MAAEQRKGGFSEEDEPDLAASLPTESEEERASDMVIALNWLQNKYGGLEDKDDEDAAKFNELDKLLPNKGGQSAEDRAKEI
jgi:hypothetical protein